MKQLARDDAPERMLLADFLAWEEAQPLRHERVGGTVWAMTGGTLDHNRIALNLFSALRARLDRRRCEALALNVCVVTPQGDVMYPDVVVACDESRRAKTEIRDPLLVAEVLSPGTMARDHGFKRWAYGTISSLAHYVLISQEAPEAEVATPDGDAWRSIVLRDASQSLRLNGLELEVSLEEVFAGVDFPRKPIEPGRV